MRYFGKYLSLHGHLQAKTGQLLFSLDAVLSMATV